MASWHRAHRTRGFTLLEAIVVIALTGIIAAVVASFLRAPVQGYFDGVQRAAMSDTADGASRRIARDLRLALPNSIRVSNDQRAIELLLTRSGGRYRAQRNDPADDYLDFTANDSSFEVLGPPVALDGGDQIVIHNLGIDGADAYQGATAATHVRRAWAGTGSVTTNTVSLSSTHPFPLESPTQRFHVVEGAVSYICDLGSGQLLRYAGYGIHPSRAATDSVAELTTLSGSNGSRAVLAQDVAACGFSYEAGTQERHGLVAMRIAVGRGNETITLYREVQVSNVP